MIVLCVGMYRACSTWQYGVASQILERSGGVDRLGFIWGGDFDRKVDPGGLRDSRAVLKSHDAHRRFAEELEAGRAVALYSHRDLRDVVFSWIHKTGSSFEELARLGFFDLCLENDRFWRGQPGMLVQSYAHATGEPDAAVAEIAAHIGVDLPGRDAREIAESMSFEANRKRTEAITDRLRAEGEEPSTRDQSRFDPVSLLHWNHIREGRIGGWRDAATPRQKGVMAHYFGPWLVEHGYEPDDSWAPRLAPAEVRLGIERTSHAPHREDILLDRIFRGRKGTYLDIDAPDPVHLNKTYYFYERGWRGVNLGVGDGPRDRFVEDRPHDLNLAVRLPYAPTTHAEDDGPPIRTIAALIAERQVPAPDLVSLSAFDDPGPILADLPLETWKPGAFAIEARRALIDPEDYLRWEDRLTDLGYLPAASAGPTRFYLRADLAHLLPGLAGPVGRADNYVAADPSPSVVWPNWLRKQGVAAEAGLDPAWESEFAVLLARHRRIEDELDRECRAMADLRLEVRRDREARDAELAIERAARAADREAMAEAHAAWEADRVAAEIERIRATADREAFEVDRAAHEVDRAAHEADHAAHEADRAASAIDRAAHEADRLDWEWARASWQADREVRNAAGAEQASTIRFLEGEIAQLEASVRAEHARAAEGVRAAEADRARVEADRARVEADRAGLAEELDRRLEAIRSRDRDLVDSERQLRPYRLIDRFGLVGTVYRRFHPLKRFLPVPAGGIGGQARRRRSE